MIDQEGGSALVRRRCDDCAFRGQEHLLRRMRDRHPRRGARAGRLGSCPARRRIEPGCQRARDDAYRDVRARMVHHRRPMARDRWAEFICLRRLETGHVASGGPRVVWVALALSGASIVLPKIMSPGWAINFGYRRFYHGLHGRHVDDDLPLDDERERLTDYDA
jgi:hypothetical protein